MMVAAHAAATPRDSGAERKRDAPQRDLADHAPSAFLREC
jgi:hypothetical protein